MADLSPTAGSVVKSTSAVVAEGVAGEDLTAGAVVYKKDADGEYYLADCAAGSVSSNSEIGTTYGICLNASATNGQPCDIQTDGVITIGATVVVGTCYFLSDTGGGKICPHADMIATNWASFIGLGVSTGTIRMAIENLSAQIA